MSPIKETGTKGLLLYFKQAQPKIYAEFAKRYSAMMASNGMSGLGATAINPYTGESVVIADPIANSTTAATPSSTASTISSLLTSAAQVYLTKQQIDNQNKLVSVQLDRARAGLPPLNIDPSAYGLGGPTMNIGLASNTQKLLMYGGIALAAVLLLPKLLGSRRGR